MLVAWRVIPRRLPRLPRRFGRVIVMLFALGVLLSVAPLVLIAAAPDSALTYDATNRIASIGAWLIFGTTAITLVAALRAVIKRTGRSH